jgi:hypothetical protein
MLRECLESMRLAPFAAGQHFRRLSRVSDVLDVKREWYVGIYLEIPKGQRVDQHPWHLFFQLPSC